MFKRRLITQSIFGRNFCVYKNHKGFSNGEIAVFGWENIKNCFSPSFHDSLIKFDAGYSYINNEKFEEFDGKTNIFPQKIKYKVGDIEIIGFDNFNKYYFQVKDSDIVVRLLGTAGNSGKIVYFDSKYESIIDNISGNIYLGDKNNSPLILTKKKFKKNDIIHEKDVCAIIGLYKI